MSFLVFTDSDLDGAGSLLMLKWVFPNVKINTVPLSVSDIRNKYLDWLSKNSLDTYDDYERIFFLDLDTTDISDLIDHSNVTIIDHHETHKNVYKKANALINYTSSTMKLMYNIFKDKIKLNNQQIMLLSFVDDYDSYTLKYVSSYDLNILFGYYSYNSRVQAFCDRFRNGFDDFTNKEQNLILSYKKKFTKFYNELKLYKAEIDIGEKQYKFISCFVDKFVNDVAYCITRDRSDVDIVMMINLKNNRVYLRKKKNVDINLGKLAENLCDGGGHSYAAGGILNDKIKVLSKQFEPIEINYTILT